MVECQLKNIDKIHAAVKDFYPFIRDQAFLEIGSYSGGSLEHWIAILKEEQGSNPIYVVDPYDGEESNLGASTGELMASMLRVMNTHAYANHYRVKSREFFATLFPEVKFGFALIDGAHSREAMQRDVEEAWLHMSRPGIMVIDDVSWAEGFDRWIEEKFKEEGVEWLSCDDMSIPGGGSAHHQAIVRLKEYVLE